MDPGLDQAVWPDEMGRARSEFYAIRTAALLANEHRWVHRRVERIELIDERRARRQISIDFTLPALPSPPWEEERTWLVPIALLRRQLLTDLDVRGQDSSALPVLTREQNSRIAYELLRFLAQETLAEAFGPDIELLPLLDVELRDVAGCRRTDDDHPSELVRQRRTERAIKRFRRAASTAAVRGHVTTRLGYQRLVLWRDRSTRGFLSTLADRFIVLVPLEASANTRLIVKLSYEQGAVVPPLVPPVLRSLSPVHLRRLVRIDRAITTLGEGVQTLALQVEYTVLSAIRQLLSLDRTIRLSPPPALFRGVDITAMTSSINQLMHALRRRTGSSFGLDPLSLRVPTRAVYGPESYHVEVVAPAELLIEYARLERETTILDLALGTERQESVCIAEDAHTERAHLYESLYTTSRRESAPIPTNEEVRVSSAIKVEFLMRPSFVLPSLLIGLITSGMLASGLVLHGVGVPRQGDVTALLVVLPALFAAYLIPGEHRLVRRMFRGVRFLVFLLSLASFVAAGSLTLSLSSTARVTLWAVLLGISSASTATIFAAWLTSMMRAGGLPHERSRLG